MVTNGLTKFWMNTKIEFSTNQSLNSKLEILLRDAKSWIGQFIKSAPTVSLNPLREWKSKELKLTSLHTTHKKVSPKMSIHKTMDWSKKNIWQSSPTIEHQNSWTCLLSDVWSWTHLSICIKFNKHYNGREKFYVKLQNECAKEL
jgi:hypothetical protein